MDKNRLWVIGAVLVMAIVVGLGWFLGIAPQLASVAAADAERAGVEQVNVQHEATLAQLKKDYANLGALNGQLASLSESVPSDTAMPAFVDEINAIASNTGVTVTGFAVADAKPYEPVSPPAGAGAPAAASSSTATPSPSATPGATPTPTAPPTPAAGMPPVTSPKLTAANFSSLAVTLNIQGGYQQILSFVHGVQSGKRLFLVSGITTSAAAAAATKPAGAAPSGSENAIISGLVYVVTPDAAPTAAPTPTPSK